MDELSFITKREPFLCASVIDGTPTYTSEASHRELMRQPARVQFHCAKILHGTQMKARSPRTVDS